MSLFSGMKLAGSSQDKPVIVKDSLKKEIKTSASEKEVGTSLSNFSFIPDLDGLQQKTDVISSGNTNISKTDDTCSGSTTNPDLCKDNDSGFLNTKVEVSGPNDKLTFDLDPIKVTRDDKQGGEKHHALDLDLQDLDFGVSLRTSADKTLTQDNDIPIVVENLASKSSFSFISNKQVIQVGADEKPEDGHRGSDVHSVNGTTEHFEDKSITTEVNGETASQREDAELMLKQQLQGYVQNHTEKLGQIQKSIRELTSSVSEATKECILIGQDLVKKQDRLQTLKQIQQQAIDAEDYERAEELHNQCQDLETEISTSSSPLPCNHPALRGHLGQLELLYEQEDVVRQEITEKYKELIAEQKEVVSAAHRRCSDVESSHLGKLQEDRSNLDKDQQHLELDKERLHKQEDQLEDRIAESTASLCQARELLITDREQVQEEIQTLEAKLAALRCQESLISDSIKEKDGEIKAAVQKFDDERLAIVQERKLIEGVESDLRERKDDLDEEERRTAACIAEFKEIMTRETKRLSDLKESLKEEKATISNLANRDVSKLTNLWPDEEASLENTKQLTKKDAAKQKMIEVQEATVELVQSQTRLMALRQKVSDVEGLIAALSEAKQLAVSGQNFQEAKRLTDEIKHLTLEGQHAQEEIEELSKSNEDASRMVKMLRDGSERLQEEAAEEEKAIELSRKDKLLEYITIVKEQLQDATLDPLIRTVQNAEVASSLLKVKFLCLKHQEPLPEYLEELVQDCLPGDTYRETLNMCYQVTQEDNHMTQDVAVESSTEKLGTKSQNTETLLEGTVEVEDSNS